MWCDEIFATTHPRTCHCCIGDLREPRSIAIDRKVSKSLRIRFTGKRRSAEGLWYRSGEVKRSSVGSVTLGGILSVDRSQSSREKRKRSVRRAGYSPLPLFPPCC